MLEMRSGLQAGVQSKNAAGRGRRQWSTNVLCMPTEARSRVAREANVWKMLSIDAAWMES